MYFSRMLVTLLGLWIKQGTEQACTFKLNEKEENDLEIERLLLNNKNTLVELLVAVC